MTFGSLFAGAGGIDLGFERAGMQCRWQVENNPFCQRVLAKHWPHVKRYGDIKKFCRRASDCEPENEEGECWCPRCDVWFSECECIGTDQLIDECGGVDVICAGFPCQPVSINGKGKAQDDDRWLWPEVHRVVCQLRPGYLVLENVTGLLARGLDGILGDLASIGYDAEWDCIPAAAFGANHIRDRVFVIAYPAIEGLQGQVAACQVWGSGVPAKCNWWCAEPPLARLGHGIPGRVAGTIAMGNAVVPQVAEFIGRRLMALNA